MSSLPVRTPGEVLDELRKLILKSPEARSVAIYVFGWACGVCRAAGLTLDELEGFIRKYKNDGYEKDVAP
jgi:hypothetical protein